MSTTAMEFEEPWPTHGCAQEVCEVCALERRKRGIKEPA